MHLNSRTPSRSELNFLGAWTRACCALALLLLVFTGHSEPTISPLNSPQLWKRFELRLQGLPSVTNTYDPDTIRVDAWVELPSRKQQTWPAFWYQPYSRSQTSSGGESLTPIGPAEWRLRLLPSEPGEHLLRVEVVTNGTHAFSLQTSYTVSSNAPTTRTGVVRVAGNGQFFETSDGQPLPLIGANVCWHGSRGTFDYVDWFSSMANAGENFARLWMWPHAFGIEADANTLTKYRQDRAWQLDYVFNLAEARGIYLLLCLDYHGMFETTPDYWGGNNMWPKNPYNAANGGPCLNPNGFFTNSVAQKLYQKRLRYLVARYGASPNLFAWEFFNEIDNVYSYLKAADVMQWHRLMGQYLRTNDPAGHLVTTSFTGSSDRPEVWALPEMDFTQYHSYNGNQPGQHLNQVSQSFLARYRKPVLIGEYGMDFRGWRRENDPYLRGFRQGLWGGALGGSAGSGMSWWWERLHTENVYPYYAAMGKLLKPTGWARGGFTNLHFRTAGPPPVLVGEPIQGEAAFDAHLVLGTGWGDRPRGELAITSPSAATRSGAALNAFVHGQSHRDLQRPFRLSAWLEEGARLVMHVNSVSSGSALVVKADGAQLFRTNLPNQDSYWQVTNEYNMDISVPLPAGRRLIEITNAGADWFYLDWVRVERVMPSNYEHDWQPDPAAWGQIGQRESLVYVVSPEGVFSGVSTNAILPLQHGRTLTLSNFPPGEFHAQWYDPVNAASVAATSATVTNGLLTLPLPEFREDLFGVVFARPQLSVPRLTPQGMEMRVESETGGVYSLEKSTNLLNWVPVQTITNQQGSSVIHDAQINPGSRFYRLSKPGSAG